MKLSKLRTAVVTIMVFLSIVLSGASIFWLSKTETYTQTIETESASKDIVIKNLEIELEKEKEENSEIRQQALEYKDALNQISMRNEGIYYQEGSDKE